MIKKSSIKLLTLFCVLLSVLSCNNSNDIENTSNSKKEHSGEKYVKTSQQNSLRSDDSEELKEQILVYKREITTLRTQKEEMLIEYVETSPEFLEISRQIKNKEVKLFKLMTKSNQSEKF